ncbi:hypothetical protein [Leptolyngbya sp. FACHB-711]|uniref:hypothetical protein n=1 Tax=Leptolyngbya sp. FACHB-711 TaxID=2692813 RepID=UPI0016874806|nr:hypothetical protein [Leptolyngbya sp. FACHB-711]MBD2028268.1 hypothetical protein [Leptolyngbya sp. FACHB-711]
MKARLAELETEIAALQAAGEIVLNGRIDFSVPGGTTVRGQPSVQRRLRIPGQKARYLRESQVEELQAAIDRGRQLKKLEREQQRLKIKMA